MDVVPSEEDWRSEPWDLDTQCAHEHFAGKTREDALLLFEKCALFYQEDLTWMPRACLPFYLNVYIDYLESGTAASDSDAASCFYGLVDVRRETLITFGDPLLNRVITILERLPEKQDWFDADEEIYGSFEKRSLVTLKKLRKAIRKANL